MATIDTVLIHSAVYGYEGVADYGRECISGSMFCIHLANDVIRVSTSSVYRLVAAFVSAIAYVSTCLD